MKNATINAINLATDLTDTICQLVHDNFALVAFASLMTIPVAFACGYFFI